MDRLGQRLAESVYAVHWMWHAQEDMRQFPFPSFADSKHAPTSDQLHAARDLVSSLSLTFGVSPPLLHLLV